jgi:hypothetical protein
VGDNRVLLSLLGGARVLGVALREPSQILQQPVPVHRSPFLGVLSDRSIAGLWGVGCAEGGIDERAWQRRRFAKDAFTPVLAFSPGFLAPAERVGSPRIFVSHGTRDGWLPIERCSRRIVPQLERAGYEVRYREFDGDHVVPPEIGRKAANWFTAT